MSTAPIPKRRLDLDEQNWWDLWNTSYRSVDGVDPIPEELFMRVAEAVNEVGDLDQSRILEVACGAGGVWRFLRCRTYHGLDMSPAAVDRAQQKCTEYRRRDGMGEPSYEVADIHTWNSPEIFDQVICVDAVVWFRDQPLALKRMAESLRPGGKLVMTAINPFIYHRIKRNSKRPLQEGPVSNWLSKEELHSLVEAAGLALERSETIMPSGNSGLLRIINSPRLNRAFGPAVQGWLKRSKERAGIGQYRLIVARKPDGGSH